MIRPRKVIFTAIATMTPAFFAEVSAKAYSPAPLAAVAIPDDAGVVLGKQLLKQKLLAMTPTEKMRLGGDRIRLAKSSGQSATQGAGAANANRKMGTLSSKCSGMLFA